MNSRPLSFEIADNTHEPEGFLMVLGSDKKAYWNAGSSDFDSIYEQFGITKSEKFLDIYVALNNDMKYPYAFPESGEWTACITSCPSWWDDECKMTVETCFAQWAEQVYSKYDHIGAGRVDERIAEVLAAAPDDDYQATEEDIRMFNAYARCKFRRDDMYDIICEELGHSVGDCAYRYLKENFADKLKHEAGIAPLLRSMNITNTGGTQENFGGAIIAGYFNLESEDWSKYSDVIDLANQFLAKGMTFGNASDKMNRLHSYKNGRILHTTPASEASDDHAFSCLVDREGRVYWKLGIDNYIKLREMFGLPQADSAAFKVEPELNGNPESYIVPDGLNPEVDRHFEFFEEDAVTWVAHSLDEGGKPDWVDEAMESSVMSACEAWKKEAYSHFDRDALMTFFEKDNYADSYGDDEIRLLKDYVNSQKRPGPPARIEFLHHVAETIGPTLADLVEEWAGSKWRQVHTDCPQPCMKIGYCKYKGYENFNRPDQRIEDTFPFVAAAHFLKDIDWHTADGSCPFESAAELMRRGYVVFTDFENWYLTSGAQCDVLLEISEEDLMSR